MSEYAPPPPKVRVSKAQLRKQQKAYEQAAKLVGDHSEQEAIEKEADIEKLEEELGDAF